MTTAPTVDPLEAGRKALALHDWPEVYDLLSAADRAGGLSGDDLERLAEASFFVARASEPWPRPARRHLPTPATRPSAA